ncbi:hypothetical protein SK128_012373 [Halocaridina rubra]|uniref:Uncharacterized protein n=1 Tax=Halocaridina rubra TaxID=373956 RepID=A0AAN8X9L3_HALRR
MALNIVTRQKVLLSSLFMGGPLCSYAALRCPAYSSFKVINRVYENMNVNLTSKCDALATPTLVSSRLLHHGHKNMTENNTYATGTTLSERDSDSENDNDSENEVNILLDSKTKLSSRDWNNLMEKLKSDHRYSQVPSLDGIIMKQCLRQENYWLATSYTEYLNSQGKEPNLLGLGCYLQLCGLSIEECGEEKVLDVYNQLCSKVKLQTVNEFCFFLLPSGPDNAPSTFSYISKVFRKESRGQILLKSHLLGRWVVWGMSELCRVETRVIQETCTKISHYIIRSHNSYLPSTL